MILSWKWTFKLIIYAAFKAIMATYFWENCLKVPSHVKWQSHSWFTSIKSRNKWHLYRPLNPVNIFDTVNPVINLNNMTWKFYTYAVVIYTNKVFNPNSLKFKTLFSKKWRINYRPTHVPHIHVSIDTKTSSYLLFQDIRWNCIKFYLPVKCSRKYLMVSKGHSVKYG